MLIAKTDMQMRFEEWMSQTGGHRDYQKENLLLSVTVSLQGFTNESRKLASLSESW